MELSFVDSQLEEISHHFYQLDLNEGYDFLAIHHGNKCQNT